MEEKQGFYAIITSDVLFDPNLTEFQKLLFAYMSLLTVKEGYSWATNKHYAEKFEKDEKTISRAIRELEDCGYLKSFVDAKAGNKRKIFLNTNPATFGDRTKMSIGSDKNVQRGSDKNVTYNSNIDNNKKECTGDSQVSVKIESSAPQVKANPETRGSGYEPPLSVQNTLSKNETDYKQTLMGLIKKFAREFWERPDIGGFVDYCWREGKEFEIKVWNRKKYVPGLEALLKTHFEGEIGEMNKKKEELKADHSDAERTVKEFLDMCLDNWHNEWRSYRKHVEIYKGKRDVLASDYEALKKLYMDNKWNEVTFVFEVYGRHKNKMHEMMGFEWSKFAANRKATLEEALKFYNERPSWVIPGWPKQQ